RGNYHLAQQIEGKAGFRCLSILDNDLGQDEPRDVFPGGSIDDLHIVPLLKKRRSIISCCNAAMSAAREYGGSKNERDEENKQGADHCQDNKKRETREPARSFVTK